MLTSMIITRAAAVITITNNQVLTGVAIANYTPNAGFTNTVSGGWHGPYLYTAGSSFYGDGWFNQNTGDPCDFDWVVNTTPVNVANVFPDISDLRIKSLGSDKDLGGAETCRRLPLKQFKHGKRRMNGR